MRAPFRVAANLRLMLSFFVRSEKHEVLCGVDARKSASGRSARRRSHAAHGVAPAVWLRCVFRKLAHFRKNLLTTVTPQ
jgi:hypothetical protein